ncbi:MAG: thioredoxin family protein, partial [Cycloclasticus sp.]|nr:thioredoxin family protein [Cycloclasticus sp.]
KFSLNQQNSVQQHALPINRIKNIDELNSALQTAAKNKQFVMLDFYADWCVSCKEMEAFTFTEPAVQKALSNTVLLQADVTENNDDDRILLNTFSLIGPPAILFFDLNSIELKRSRVVGYMKAPEFLKKLKTLN